MNVTEPKSFLCFRGLIVAASLLLVITACAMKGLQPDDNGACKSHAPDAQHLAEAEWHVDSQLQEINVLGRNLKMPRAPRQKCDRPSSEGFDVEGTTDVVLSVVARNDGGGMTIFPAAMVFPQAGHPLSLLRPPSLMAG